MTTDPSPTDDLGWHVVSGAGLLALLRRAGNGEDPDLLLMEAWANSNVRQVCGATDPVTRYRCSDWIGHTPGHTAILDGEVLATWD